MLFSKCSKIASILAFIFFVAACAPTGGKKRGDDNITLLEDAEKQTTLEYAENYDDGSDSAEEGEGEDLAYSDSDDSEQDGLADDPFAVDESSYAEGALPVDGAADAEGVESSETTDPYAAEQPVDSEISSEETVDEQAVDQYASEDSEAVTDDTGYTEDTTAEEGGVVEPAAVEEVPKLTIQERFGANPYLSNPPLVVEQAKIDFAAALALLKAEADSLKVDKSDTKNLESKAEVEEKKAPETDATKQMKAVVENYPELSGPAYNLAYYYYQLDYDSDAIKYLDIATARNFYNLDAHNLKAKIYRDRSDFENAEKAYKEAISAWGGFLPAYKNLGIMYDLYMGQPEKAYEYYKQYNDYNPEEDRQVIGWAVVIERKLKAQQMMAEREAQAKAEAEAQRQAEEAAANGASAGVAGVEGEAEEAEPGQGDSAEVAAEQAPEAAAVEGSGSEAVSEDNSAVDAALEAAEAEQVNAEAE